MAYKSIVTYIILFILPTFLWARDAQEERVNIVKTKEEKEYDIQQLLFYSTNVTGWQICLY